MEILFILIGLITGSIFTLFVLKSKFKSKIDVAEERTKIFEEQNRNLSAELNTERGKVLDLNSSFSSLKADYGNLQKTLAEQKEETEKLQEKFAAEFENLANKILEEKSSKFTLQNKENLDQILKPLGEKIKEFEKKVNEVYITDSKERASLAEQLRSLRDLNQLMAKEANNLTNALKGETKTMGNWGEFILESILEKSGLVKGREYKIQENFTNEEGRRLQPDVIVNLPDNKCLVIDSKVSLLAYENYSSSENENEKSNSLKEHIASIKRHIRDLSSKNYQNILPD